MKLISLLLRSSRGTIIVSTLAGAAGGIASVALLAIIQAEINRQSPPRAQVAWTFGGLAILSAAARFAAQLSMIRLGQESVARLNVRLISKTLMLPLRRFEKLNVDALLSV